MRTASPNEAVRRVSACQASGACSSSLTTGAATRPAILAGRERQLRLVSAVRGLFRERQHDST